MVTAAVSETPASPLRRVSMAEQVVDGLRAEILGGDLRPGTSLREHALAERFDVARSTVREAIRALVAEGLVTHHMHRGAVVTEPTADDVHDLLLARAALECAAAEVLLQEERGEAGGQATGSAGGGGLGQVLPAAADLTACDDALAAMEAAVARGDGPAVAAADAAFHREFVALAGSPRLAAFHRTLQGELRLLLAVAERDRPEPDKVAGHGQILTLVRSGDVAALTALLRAHVVGAESTLLELLRRD